MNFKKFTFLKVTLAAVLGIVVFSQVPVTSSVSFVIGVIVASILFYLPFPMSLQPAGDKSATKTLYVGNLPYKANETNIRQLFSQHGKVFAVRLMKDKRTGKRRGFGFVVIANDDVENIISTLNGYDYMQRTLKIRIANDPKHPESESSSED